MVNPCDALKVNPRLGRRFPRKNPDPARAATARGSPLRRRRSSRGSLTSSLLERAVFRHPIGTHLATMVP